MKMKMSRRILACAVSLWILGATTECRAQDSPLETALGNLYGICLFEKDPHNPFSNAAELSRDALAPGLAGFIESNLAAVPLTPPSIRSVFEGGEIVNVIAGFTPVFTENSSTVGRGKAFFGANVSYYDFSKIRGRQLSETEFTFAQNDGSGDVVSVTMPMDVKAQVYTLYGTYGVTNAFDIGVALPLVNFEVRADGTVFVVERKAGDTTGCGYSAAGPLCNGEGNDSTPELSLGATPVTGVSEDELTETFLSTLAMRFKYRVPGVTGLGRVATVLDLRLPTRSGSSVLGSGDFGGRLTFVTEAPTTNGFTPYVNVGAQLWSGEASSSLRFASGFTQLFADKVAFSFDLLGELDVQSDEFLVAFDDDPLGTDAEASVMSSSIPSVGRDHELNLALGLQWGITTDLQVYTSTMFSLLDRGLHSSVVPTIGVAYHH